MYVKYLNDSSMNPQLIIFINIITVFHIVHKCTKSLNYKPCPTHQKYNIKTKAIPKRNISSIIGFVDTIGHAMTFETQSLSFQYPFIIQ